MRALIAILLLLALPAYATVYRCLLSDGRILYQDVPCAQAPGWSLGDAVPTLESQLPGVVLPSAQVVDLARQRAQAEIEEARRLREAEAKAQAEAERVAREEQQRLNDFYRRCRLREMEVRSAEDLGQTYWGLPWVRARAELLREQFGFECWR